MADGEEGEETQVHGSEPSAEANTSTELPDGMAGSSAAMGARLSMHSMGCSPIGFPEETTCAASSATDARIEGERLSMHSMATSPLALGFAEDARTASTAGAALDAEACTEPAHYDESDDGGACLDVDEGQHEEHLGQPPPPPPPPASIPADDSIAMPPPSTKPRKASKRQKAERATLGAAVTRSHTLAPTQASKRRTEREALGVAPGAAAEIGRLADHGRCEPERWR